MNTTGIATTKLNNKRIFILLALYFTIHLFLRIFVSDGAELDEAEQLLLTQELRLGYGSQPPVYTWLLTGLFAVFSNKILAMAVLKNGLLFMTYVFVYHSAKELTRDSNRAAIAMLSLLLIPQIFWESQRDLTHSVLGTTVAACTLFVMLRLLKTGRLIYYVLFGLCAGTGIMSKYNYGVFLVALLLAASSLTNLRPRILDRKMLLSLLCMLLVTTPHFYWAITNMKATLSQSGKFQIGRSLGLFESYALGFSKLFMAVVSFLGLLLPAFALFFYRKGADDSAAGEARDYSLLIKRTLLTGLVLCSLMILFFKVTVFKDRWMQPLLFATPLYLITLSRGSFTQSSARRYAVFILIVAAGVLLFMPGHTLYASKLAQVGRLNHPYAALSEQLRLSGFRGGMIISQGRLLGGNLKLFFPQSIVVAPEVPLFAAPVEADRLIIWDATDSPIMPENLRKFAATFTDAEMTRMKAEYIQAPYKYAGDRSMSLGFILVRKSTP